MRIAIATDSTSGIQSGEAERMGITVLPMPVNINGQEYLEGVDLEQDFFFRKQAEGANITTSQPSPGAVTALWEKLLEVYDQVLYLPMTSGLSSACATARALAADYGGRVLVADVKRISVPLWQAVQDALTLVRRGLLLPDICKKLEEKALSASVYITPLTLEFLKRGGRITPAAAALGMVLNLKPILQIQGGAIDAYAKVRGMKQAVERMFAALDRDLETRFAGKPVRVFAAYSGEPSVGEAWADQIRSHYGDAFYRIDPLSLNICCHTGPGTIGLGCAEYEV